MPRAHVLTESGNKNTGWTTRTVNAENSTSIPGGSPAPTRTQQQDLNTCKVGRIWKLAQSMQWKASAVTDVHCMGKFVINGTSYDQASYTCTTSYVTKTNTANTYATLYTQAHLDAMYIEEWGENNNTKTARTIYATSRSLTVTFTFEHKVAGLAPLNFAKIGGLVINKLWKIGGRSQISGTSDVAI